MSSGAIAPSTWAAFAANAPDLAAEALALLHQRSGDGVGGFLATVRGDLPPRIHPVTVGVVDGGLFTFILPSPKRTDLEEDGRFALHAHQDPNAPGELALRGRAIVVTDPARRAAVAAVWPFTADETYELFELRLQTVVVGRRPSADDWPPRYETWSAARA